MHQIISRPRPDLAPDNSSNTRSQVIVITAISLFALAGFLLGFTAGALNRPSHTAVQPPPVEQKVRLGCPIVNWPTDNTMIADGSTNYTFTAQAVDKSIDNTTPCGKGNPVQKPGITCRLWLSKIPDNKLVNIPASILGNTDTLGQQSMPGEIQGGLAYDPTTPETQMCNDKGQATWKFTVSPSVDRGQYYIVVLTDWGGVYSNWSWDTFKVRKMG